MFSSEFASIAAALPLRTGWSTLADDLHAAGWVDRAGDVAVYLSAGDDLRGLVYLAPSHLEARGVHPGEVDLDVSVLVMVDQSAYRVPRHHSLCPAHRGELAAPPLPFFPAHDDEHTSVWSQRASTMIIGELAATVYECIATSDRYPKRRYAVVLVSARNQEVIASWQRARCAPKVVIAVTDGCAFGGNMRCESRTRRKPEPHALYGSVVPRYWVTDHNMRDGSRRGRVVARELVNLGGWSPFNRTSSLYEITPTGTNEQEHDHVS